MPSDFVRAQPLETMSFEDADDRLRAFFRALEGYRRNSIFAPTMTRMLKPNPTLLPTASSAAYKAGEVDEFAPLAPDEEGLLLRAAGFAFNSEGVSDEHPVPYS
ncbi:MAG: hypothetical protein M1816_002229 [Peltula sp. TS41687]|nr:MAG: hypothetical protein M1816_002229 [Peltula sp. TS41687]